MSGLTQEYHSTLIMDDKSTGVTRDPDKVATNSGEPEISVEIPTENSAIADSEIAENVTENSHIDCQTGSSSILVKTEDLEQNTEESSYIGDIVVSDEVKETAVEQEASLKPTQSKESAMAANQVVNKQFILLCKTKGKIKGCPVDNFRCESLSTVSTGEMVYKLTWNGEQDELAKIMKWFEAEVKPQDVAAVMEFPCTVSESQITDIHQVCAVLDLAPIRRGYREKTFLCVYTSRHTAKKILKPKKAFDEGRSFLSWMQNNNKTVPGNPKYTRAELFEMIKLKSMDPDVEELYAMYKNCKSGKQLSQTETRGNKEADIKWVKPGEGSMGHFFFNKLYVDGNTDSGSDGHVEYPNIGVTEVLTFDDLVPTEDLRAVLITNDEWFSDSLYISKYFPHSVNVTIVCPPHKPSNQSVNRVLAECPVHRYQFAKLDGNKELVNVQCGCPEVRYIKVISPRSADKMNSKLIIARYSQYARIVIGSASFNQDSWESIGQYGWYCDLPIDQHNNAYKMETSSSSLLNAFGLALKNFLLNISPELTTMLDGINFSVLSPTVKLVTSVPSSSLSRPTENGLNQLKTYIAGIKWPKDSQPVFVYQSPDVSYERRIWSFLYLLNYCLGTDINKRQMEKDRPWDYLDRVSQSTNKIVFPCVSSRSEAMSRYQFPLCLQNVNYEDSFFQIRPYMVENTDPVFGKISWNARVASRLCNVNKKETGLHRYGWLLVGSHSLSYQAWGETMRSSIIKMSNYELSVLHVPHKVISAIGGVQVLAPDFSSVTLPYREEHLQPYPRTAYPLSLLNSSPSAQPQNEEERIYHLITKVRATGNYNQTNKLQVVATPGNDFEEEFFRKHKDELLTTNEETGYTGDIALMKDVFQKAYPERNSLPDIGSLLIVVACKMKKGRWRVSWVLDCVDGRNEPINIGGSHEASKLNVSVHLADPLAWTTDAIKKRTCEGDTNIGDLRDGQIDWQPEKGRPMCRACSKCTGITVVGMEGSSYLNPETQPMQIIKPVSRNAYIQKQLTSLYNIDLTNKSHLHGPTSVQYKRAVLACAKRRFIQIE